MKSFERDLLLRTTRRVEGTLTGSLASQAMLVRVLVDLISPLRHRLGEIGRDPANLEKALTGIEIDLVAEPAEVAG